MKVILLACLLLVVRTTSAWFRSQERTATADGALIDQNCEDQANEGSCSFYGCFEQRLPCGREFYMQRYGSHYCNRFARYMTSFTPEGQEFVRRAQRCMTQRLLEYYRRDYVNCHRLEHSAVDLVTPCFTESGFCEIFSDNANAFMDVFQFQDLFRTGAGKLWREIYDLARSCGGDAFQDFMAATASRVSEPLRSFLSIFNQK